MLKAEYHERVEQAFWKAAGDKRIPPTYRLKLRFQAGRFRALAKMAKKHQGQDDPSTEQVGHIARQLGITPAKAWKIFAAQQNSDSALFTPLNAQPSRKKMGSASFATKGIAKGAVEYTFDEETWAQAKPMFIAAAQGFCLAAKDIGKFANHLVDELRDVYGFTKENFEAMKPYLMRFLKEVRDGTIKLVAP
jgi:hypothetical protein